MRKEILLTGFGGQGLILAGILMAESAVLYQGLNATQNQAYGIEARGGECRSEVILSDATIHHADVDAPDVVLCMSQMAFDKFAPLVKEGGLVVIDTVFVEDTGKLKPGSELKSYPITEICNEATGRTIMANVTALGILAQLTGLITPENMEKEILSRVPPGTEDTNRRALFAGVEAARAG